MDNFVNLHVHTTFSLLDGAIWIPDLAAKVKAAGMPAVAVTDHGNMMGAVKFYRECLAQGVKPIIGTEFYVDPGGCRNRDPQKTRAFHLTVLAKDNAGLVNLMRLNTLSHRDGFYYKPRVDWDLLAQYAEGLICLSGCLKGELAFCFFHGLAESFWETLRFYRQTFDEDYYLEIQTNTTAEQVRYNTFLKELAREEGIPLVLTTDAHYLDRADAEAHDVLLCIQTNARLDQEDRMRLPTDDFFLHTPKDVYAAGRDEAELEAARRTLEIADRCRVELPLGQRRMPNFLLEGLVQT